MAYQDLEFQSHGLVLKGRCFSADEPGRPGLLFVPGAMPAPYADSDEFNEWREELCDQGINSFVYDGPGFGVSEVDQEGNSLAKRILDAKAAYKTFLTVSQSDPQRLAVIGSSMAGHIVARLIESQPNIRCVILDRAAAYSEEAESKVFGPDFSAAIRKPGSWRDSPAFPIFQNFHGRVLIIYGDQEEVVPVEVQRAFIDAVGERGQVLSISGGSHFFLRDDTPEGKQRKQPFFSTITEFLIKQLKP